jgi:hypothetical protein
MIDCIADWVRLALTKSSGAAAILNLCFLPKYSSFYYSFSGNRGAKFPKIFQKKAKVLP